MKYSIAIIGPKNIIQGFSLLGARPLYAESGEEFLRIFQELQRNVETEPYAVVIVIENILRQISEEEYQHITKNPLPSIVSLPGIEGSTGYSAERLKKMTQKAIGSDIF